MPARRPAKVTIPPAAIKLEKAPIEIKGYGTDGGVICTLYVNATGIEVFNKDSKKFPLCSLSWKQLVSLLNNAQDHELLPHFLSKSTQS